MLDRNVCSYSTWWSLQCLCEKFYPDPLHVEADPDLKISAECGKVLLQFKVSLFTHAAAAKVSPAVIIKLNDLWNVGRAPCGWSQSLLMKPWGESPYISEVMYVFDQWMTWISIPTEWDLAPGWERGPVFPGCKPWKKKHIPRQFRLVVRPNLYGILQCMKYSFMYGSISWRYCLCSVYVCSWIFWCSLAILKKWGLTWEHKEWSNRVSCLMMVREWYKPFHNWTDDMLTR